MPAVIDGLPRSPPTSSTSRCQIHTDTLNESGFFEHTLRAIDGPHDPHLPLGGRGRRPRARHYRGSPARPTACPSSTNPTNPYTLNTFDEHLDMVMAAIT